MLKLVDIFFSAKALQTILVLAGPQGLYKRWADRSQELNVRWSLDTAKQVLEAWQRRFTEVKASTDPARYILHVRAFCV